jgi:hypothetical protein
MILSKLVTNCMYKYLLDIHLSHETFASTVNVGSKVYKRIILLQKYLSTPMKYLINKKIFLKFSRDSCNNKLVGSTLNVDLFWLERRYVILISSSDGWMSNEYFYMQFATSFYRIIWKIIVKVVEEAHNYFTEIA